VESRTQRLLRRTIRQIIEAKKSSQGDSCPAATQNLELNTRNRNAAIKAEHIEYGPLNLADEEYWEHLAEHWNTTADVAKQSTCGNCAAFDISPKMQECMPGEIMPQEEIDAARESGEPWQTLGYCWMHHFKCHSARSCYTWAAGGPINSDKISASWQQKSEKSVKESRRRLFLLKEI
jgi:hypothetical protein